MIKLDLKDRRLLYELDLNSRQSYHELAKTVGLSKDAVIYRIKRFQNSGLIQQFHTVIDVGKLGLISFRLYLKLQNTTPEKETEIINYLKQQPQITWLISMDGGYDLGLWVLTKTVAEMNSLWKDLLDRYRDFIEKRWLTIFTKVSYFPRTYLLEQKKNRTAYCFISEPQACELDELDWQLLRLMAPDARITLLELAQKLHLTSKTINSRIKKLQQQKVIVGYRTRFDLKQLGYQYFKVHFNLHNLTPEKAKQFRSYLSQNPFVVYDNEVLGGDDLEIEVQMPTLIELRSFLEEVKQQFADVISNYKYFLFYKEHKYLFFPI